MINRVIQYIKAHHMIDEGDCVVAGVSGGADSVCLFVMLLEIRKVIPMDIRVVHVNHLIRGDASADASYVENLCHANDIPFTLIEEDVEALARKLHISTEEAGRDVRYQAFYRELGSARGKIAVAHNRNDCCETFLFHLFRGSSLRGLTGIRPVRDRIIRPLLCLERCEIESFLQERGIAYCIDSTNLEDNYSRNMIRHHILAAAERDISPAAVKHIGNACDRVSEAYDLIEDIARQSFDTCVNVMEEKDTGVRTFYIDKEKFSALHATIQGYVIMEALSAAAGCRKDLEEVHIRQVQELMNRQCGKVAVLPYHLRAERDYSGVSIYTERAPRTVISSECSLSDEMQTALLSGQIVDLAFENNQKISAALVSDSDFGADLENIPQKKYTKWIDYDKIKDSIVIRTRRPGDYLTVNAENQRKTLKAYCIDRKIPREERGNICLVADGSHIIWMVGERISNYYKVTEDTRRVLRLSYRKEDKKEIP